MRKRKKWIPNDIFPNISICPTLATFKIFIIISNPSTQLSLSIQMATARLQRLQYKVHQNIIFLSECFNYFFFFLLSVHHIEKEFPRVVRKFHLLILPYFKRREKYFMRTKRRLKRLSFARFAIEYRNWVMTKVLYKWRNETHAKKRNNTLRKETRRAVGLCLFFFSFELPTYFFLFSFIFFMFFLYIFF